MMDWFIIGTIAVCIFALAYFILWLLYLGVYHLALFLAR